MSDILEDVFTDGLQFLECVAILISFNKIVGKEIQKIFNSTKKLRRKQIKGENHLKELQETVYFISKMLHKHQKSSKT